LITYPIEQTHQAIPKEIRDRIGVDEYLLRLSVGIEEVKDLIADLDQGINRE
jgi:cystathionine gamma-synthase